MREVAKMVVVVVVKVVVVVVGFVQNNDRTEKRLSQSRSPINHTNSL